MTNVDHSPASFPVKQDEKPSVPATPTLASWFNRCLEPSEWDVLILSTTLKLLLFPSYRSTDFEVHRNWLAITHSLPISRWYYDETSKWTLDYPPLFAYFERLLAIPAFFVDHRIVDLHNLNYDAWAVIAYQRTTVVLTELVLGAALFKFTKGAADPAMQRVISMSIFLHPGFLIIDHIHFQYNGFLFGVLLWSLLMARNGNYIGSGVLFAILLNLKHIYVYLAPAYFVYLLRAFCMTTQGRLVAKNFVTLANSIIAVFVASFGPFLLLGQVPQVLSRLFPFTRGLNHAYWAPNAWALFTVLDRVLLRYGQHAGLYLQINQSGVESTSRGLVGDTVFAVLPNIKPIHTFFITLAFQSIFLFKLWKKPTYRSFVTALTLCGYTSFMFGWHVHEKAIMLVVVPLSFLAADSAAHLRTFLLASVAGIYSLFPLLFTPAESFIKFVYSLIWVILVFDPMQRRAYEYPTSFISVVVAMLENCYLAGFLILHAFITLFPILAERVLTKGSTAPVMEFLPLMLTSTYCAAGLIWAFLRLSIIYLWRE